MKTFSEFVIRQSVIAHLPRAMAQERDEVTDIISAAQRQEVDEITSVSKTGNVRGNG
ncbi:hypothetical protein OH492_18070 [Vibrio chagasii]|nr:hypothetical protein [Vibrio chagasii]